MRYFKASAVLLLSLVTPSAAQQSVPIPLIPLEMKAVPRADKANGELIGTVREVVNIGVVCGVQQVWVILDVKGQVSYPVPVVAGCAGSIISKCTALRPGQRARFQGRLLALPDVTVAGTNPCDPGTWQVFLPAYGFAVTKVLK